MLQRLFTNRFSTRLGGQSAWANTNVKAAMLDKYLLIHLTNYDTWSTPFIFVFSFIKYTIFCGIFYFSTSLCIMLFYFFSSFSEAVKVPAEYGAFRLSCKSFGYGFIDNEGRVSVKVMEV